MILGAPFSLGHLLCLFKQVFCLLGPVETGGASPVVGIQEYLTCGRVDGGWIALLVSLHSRHSNPIFSSRPQTYGRICKLKFSPQTGKAFTGSWKCSELSLEAMISQCLECSTDWLLDVQVRGIAGNCTVFSRWRVATGGHVPRAGWVWGAELTCECGLGCGLLALWDFDLGVVTSRDGRVLNSVIVNGRFAIPPFQGDAAVCLGDTTKIPGSIQACRGEEGTFVWKTPGTRRGESDNSSWDIKASCHSRKMTISPTYLSH